MKEICKIIVKRTVLVTRINNNLIIIIFRNLKNSFPSNLLF